MDHTFKVKIKINKNNKKFVLLLFNIFSNGNDEYKKNMTEKGVVLSFIKNILIYNL